MFSLNYPPSFLRSVRDEPYIFKFLWSGLFLYHIEIVHKELGHQDLREAYKK